MAQLALIAVHGMGTTERTFADGLFRDVKKRLGNTNSQKLITNSIFYQDILQDNQEAYFKRVQRRVDWAKLRKFMLYGFCDAASLESQKIGPESPYFIAQSKILDTMRKTNQQLDGEDRRVIFVAQSLGGQVLSNYLWDATRSNRPRNGIWSETQNFESDKEEKFCRGKKTARLFTTGCNIPIFVAGRDRDEIKPIPRLHPNFEWHNYYDEDDVLGWPLRDLSDEYADRVKVDKRINSGLLASFSPLSHGKYWSDRDFIKPLVKHIKTLL